jgi:superfamily II DNA or RNA helicase
MQKPLVLREKIYVPFDDPDELRDELDRYFVVDLFNDDQCEPCEFIDDRPTDVCQDCANYLARKKLYKTVVKGEQPYIGFPYGKKNLIPELIPHVSDLRVLDKRPDLPFKTNLRFTGETRPHQQEAIDVMVDLWNRGSLRGILRAPARSGKTVTAIALACQLRARTLILANQHDLCQQFYKTCVGSSNQDPLTNAPALHKKGRVAVVLAEKLEDFFKGDIVISTYQKFISEVGASRLKQIESMFSLLIIDEVQRAPADSFLKVVASLNTLGKLGLTATTTRKDGMHVLNSYVLGKVIHKIQVPTLVPRIMFHETGLFPKRDYSNWTYYNRWLERQEDRTAMILQQVMKDLKAKRSIVIPCVFTSQTHELVRRINWEWGRDVAAPLVGGGSKRNKEQREATLDAARAGKIKVVVGTRSIINTGINVPLWDTLYTINWLSNPPQWIQEYSRILTPLEGKNPIIRMFLDGSSQTRGCLRTCLFKTADDVPPLSKQAKISPDQWAIANAYLKKGKMGDRRVDDEPVKLSKNGRVRL